MNKIFAIGDIHGDFKPIRKFYNYLKINKQEPDNSDTLICLGDFGANFFFNHRDEQFKEKIKKYNFTYFVIRGNHEERPEICAERNPAEWHTETFFGGQVWVENKYPYIKYAMDRPHPYSIHGHFTYIFPGAYSVDKFYRLDNGWSWFPQEQLNEDEMELGEKYVKACSTCDLVLSHTCPASFEPTDLFLSQVNQSLVDKSMERYLERIERKLNYKLWLFGHYHATRIYPDLEHSVIMLFNQVAIDIDKYFETENILESLIHFMGE